MPVFGTNGTLITHDLAFKLKAAGAMAMGISIDSIDHDRHNDFRGLPNAFELTMMGIENCKAAGLPAHPVGCALTHMLFRIKG